MKYNKAVVNVAAYGHSARAQQALLKLGYKWCDGATSHVSIPYHEPVIFMENGKLSYGDVKYANTAHPGWPAVTVEQLEADVADLNSSLDSGDDAFVTYHPIQQKEPILIKSGINPKQGAGSMQLSPTLVSPLTVAHISLAKLNGKGKYGGANFIGTNVTMTTYLDAMQRHLDKIRMGEEFDEVDDVSHWGAIGAGIDIILCARAAGTLDDDRLRCDGQLEAYKALTPMVKKLTELHAGKNPKHYLMVNKEADSA